MAGFLPRLSRGVALGLLAVSALVFSWQTVDAQANDVVVQKGTSTALGDVLVGPNGLTLYIFTRDTAGVSNCSGNCLVNWPALTVPEGTTPKAAAGLTLNLGTIKRTDNGQTQVTLDGYPLYYWKFDTAAGQTTGQGVNNVWWTLDTQGKWIQQALPEPAVKVGKTDALGDVLTGPNGITLYIFTRDTPGVSNCSGGCLANWPALTVAEGTKPLAASGLSLNLGTIKRTDNGETQVTLDGYPLYYWKFDTAAGQTTGQGVNNVWWALDSKGKWLQTAAPAASPTAAAPKPPATGAGLATDEAAGGMNPWMLAGGALAIAGALTLAGAHRRPGRDECDSFPGQDRHSR